MGAANSWSLTRTDDPRLVLVAAPFYETRLSTMGTQAHIAAVHGDAGLIEDAASRLTDLHRLWTRFEEASDVSRINAGAGHPVAVSPETVLLVGLALDAWEQTDGRYDPSVLPALLATGYDRDFAELDDTTVGSGEGSPAPGCAGVLVDVAASTVTVPAGHTIDVSGIAKGLAADLVVADLLEGGAIGACVNIGGDLRVEGSSPKPGGWIIGVEHPRAQFLLGCLRLRFGAVATSSRVKRSWGPADARQHHIIDPFTGRPADTGVQAVTVVSNEGWRAEALTTAAFLAGADHAVALLEAEGASGLIVRDDDTLAFAGAWTELLA
ncbi:MAG: FAD:protein transferase [Frankiales bacterium]|jgi:thiamine biosynthesis lipoprotein|nr:FAD:protein transferase [Frankiales bacterium]